MLRMLRRRLVRAPNEPIDERTDEPTDEPTNELADKPTNELADDGAAEPIDKSKGREHEETARVGAAATEGNSVCRLDSRRATLDGDLLLDGDPYEVDALGLFEDI